MSGATVRFARVGFVSSVLFLLVAAMAAPSLSVRALAPDDAAGSKITTSARKLLESFDETLREKALFPADSPERTNWHFIPRGRLGVSLCELGPGQQGLVRDLLGASLSDEGFKRAEQVRGLEAVLREIEGQDRRFPRSPDLYFVSIFGEPSSTNAWGWRFEGHHLALNFSLDGDRLLSATPCFYGANPAEVRSGPHKGLRVLGPLEDVARELVRSLDEKQVRTAKMGEPAEVQGTQSRTYTDSLPEGISAGDLSAEQRQILRKLLDEYTVVLVPSFRERFREELLSDGYDAIHFVWSGGTEPGEKHSYLVHSPDFVIAYANFQNDANHIHAGLRLRKNDWPSLRQEGIRRGSPPGRPDR